MKRLLITILLFSASMLSTAASGSSEPTFCEWLGESASVIALNRDNGIKEYNLIGKYLSEGKSYGEQSVVIPLIDRVYGVEGTMAPDEVAYAEQQRCEVAFVNFVK